MMTEGILSTVADWTGNRPASCPWRPFFDPFVQRVLYHRESYSNGQLAITAPDPSARLVAGVIHYDRVLKSCEAQNMKLQQEAARRGH
jgi:hypothetical protein